VDICPRVKTDAVHERGTAAADQSCPPPSPINAVNGRRRLLKMIRDGGNITRAAEA
jgi:hypothetical protein